MDLTIAGTNEEHQQEFNMDKIYISRRELEEILSVMNENKIDDSVQLIYDNSSGIGSTLDIEFGFTLNDRPVVVRVNITDSSDW